MSDFKRKPLTEEASWSLLKDLYAKYGSTLKNAKAANYQILYPASF